MIERSGYRSGATNDRSASARRAATTPKPQRLCGGHRMYELAQWWVIRTAANERIDSASSGLGGNGRSWGLTTTPQLMGCIPSQLPDGRNVPKLLGLGAFSNLKRALWPMYILAISVF